MNGQRTSFGYVPGVLPPERVFLTQRPAFLARAMALGGVDPTVVAAVVNAAGAAATTAIAAANEAARAKREAKAAAQAEREARRAAQAAGASVPNLVPSAVPWGPIALGVGGMLAFVLVLARPRRAAPAVEQPVINPKRKRRRGRRSRRAR